jgi:transposase
VVNRDQPGPLRALFARIKERRGRQIAAVATARMLADLTWHLTTKEEDYAWTRPALVQWKLPELELRAGRASRRGGNKPGPARDYSLGTVRDKEREWLGLAESGDEPLPLDALIVTLTRPKIQPLLRSDFKLLLN